MKTVRDLLEMLHSLPLEAEVVQVDWDADGKFDSIGNLTLTWADYGPDGKWVVVGSVPEPGYSSKRVVVI